MNFEQFSTNVSKVSFGKVLPGAIYIHRDATTELPEGLAALINRIIGSLKLEDSNWNILKLYKRDFKFSLLYYPSFDTYPYPELHTSYSIDLERLTFRKADYSTAENPPILHRRECFLHHRDERIEEFSIYTKQGESIGLYENTKKIGSRRGWERAIRKKGYEISKSGDLKKLSLQPKEKIQSSTEIQRHKTAISRNSLSSPMFILAQKGYLNGSYSILDYGCGRGDDLRELEAYNINAIGWDPVHRPDPDLEICDIVNLGFVVNVIEDKKERDETLLNAFSYASKLLVIAAMLGNEKIYEKFKSYKDGVITSKGTFQKYYYQGELQHYIESTLNENAIALGPGIFAVFKDKLEEQKYLLERQRSRNAWRKLSTKPTKPIDKKLAKSLYEKNKALYDEFWLTCLDLSRIPSVDEFENTDLVIQTGGSCNKVFNICKEKHGIEQFDNSKRKRVDDLITYFALEYFTKRKPYIRMPDSLRRDIKTFFNSYTDTKALAQDALFSVSSSSMILSACEMANKQNPSLLIDQHSLIVHRNFLDRLPKELRIYVGCAAQLYGELDSIDLIKIHIRSGKVTFMVYENFDSRPIPLLKERIKVKLREQDIDFFDYVGEFQPQPLYNKSMLLDESFDDFKKQKSFDQKLDGLGIATHGDRGPALNELHKQLNLIGYKIRGYKFYKT